MPGIQDSAEVYMDGCLQASKKLFWIVALALNQTVPDPVKKALTFSNGNCFMRLVHLNVVTHALQKNEYVEQMHCKQDGVLRINHFPPVPPSSLVFNLSFETESLFISFFDRSNEGCIYAMLVFRNEREPSKNG